MQEAKNTSTPLRVQSPSKTRIQVLFFLNATQLKTEVRVKQLEKSQRAKSAIPYHIYDL